MSCERNQTKIGASAGVRAGISTLQSKFSGASGKLMSAVITEVQAWPGRFHGAASRVSGMTAQAVDQSIKLMNPVVAEAQALPGRVNDAAVQATRAATGVVGQSATLSLSVLESVEGPKTLDTLTPVTAIPLILEGAATLNSFYSTRKRFKPSPRGTTTVRPHPDAQETIEISNDVPGWLTYGVSDRRSFYQETGADVEADRKYGDGSKSSKKRMTPKGANKLEEADKLAQRTRRQALLAMSLLKLGQLGSIFAGTGIARLSRISRNEIVGGIERKWFFRDSTLQPVNVWQSRLTPIFNFVDAGASKLVRSDGKMFEYKGKTWHRGTVVVETAQGQRTITHLQGISMPPMHYYYSRRLDDDEVAGIITRQKGFEPKQLPNPVGYAGQISEVESMFPAWATIKRSLIQAHLCWGDAGQPPSRGDHVSGGKGVQVDAEAAQRVENRSGSSTQQPEQGAYRPPRNNQRPGRGRQDRRSSQVVHYPAVASQPSPKRDDRHPLDRLGPTVRLGDKDYEVMVRRVVNSPDSSQQLAEATYLDDSGVWKEVTDVQARVELARKVAEGAIEPWEQPNKA